MQIVEGIAKKANPFFDEYRKEMEKSNIIGDPLYVKYEPFLEDAGYRIVEIHQVIHGSIAHYDVFLAKNDGEPDSRDCDRAYRVLYPLMQDDAGPLRDVSLTVSTPGLLRTIKDCHEFELFKGRNVRVYDSDRRTTLHGRIESFDGECLTLASCRIGDGREIIPALKLSLAQIQKAKLECVWEDAKHGN